MQDEKVRIDKYLWSVRLFKTRSLAADACKQKKILINDIPVKSSRTLQANDTFKIKHPPLYKEYIVKEILGKRVGAKLVSDYLTEITPQHILSELEMIKNTPNVTRDKGTGRPTKKDRRDLKNFFE